MIYWKNMMWEVGMRWGNHHPDTRNKDWYGEEAVSIVDDELQLNILHRPRRFDVGVREFCSGCLSSIDHVHHGLYNFEYTLPMGRNLWPAIWLCSANLWPPEIDIMEGWTGAKFFGKVRRDYRRLPWKNNIFPSLHYTDGGKVKCLSLHDGLLKGTMACRQPMGERCTCDMIWNKDGIEIFYNKHLVARYSGKKVLALLDEPMTIILDLFCGYNYTLEDQKDYNRNGQAFIIHDFNYQAF